MNQIQTNPSVQMKQCQNTDLKFNLIIREKLESKIRFLCDKFPNTEWSGIMFYKPVSGDLDKGTLVLSAEDFYLLDVGTAGYTEYEPTPEVLGYQIDNDLLDCFWAGEHSHNNMDTWFSGTDINTLNKIGESMNHFLSLIVNNAGHYNARLTRIIDENANISSKCNYKSFNNANVEFDKNYIGSTKYVEWIPANIFIEEVKNCLSEEEKEFINSKIAEIQEKKSINKQKYSYYQLELFGDNDKDDKNAKSFEYNDIDNIDDFDEEYIKRFIYSLITGDLLYNTNTIKRLDFDNLFKYCIDIANEKSSSINNLIKDNNVFEYIESIYSYIPCADFGNIDDELWMFILNLFDEHSNDCEWCEVLFNSLIEYIN